MAVPAYTFDLLSWVVLISFGVGVFLRQLDLGEVLSDLLTRIHLAYEHLTAHDAWLYLDIQKTSWCTS